MQKGCLSYDGSGRLRASGFGPAVRITYILHYVISGTGYCACGNTIHKVSAGETFLILPDSIMHYYPDENDPWEYIWVDFSGEDATDFLLSSGFSAASPVCPKADFDLLPYFEKVRKEGKIRNNRFATQAALYSLLAVYVKHFPKETYCEKNSSLNIDDIVKYISNHIHLSTLSVESVAHKFNLDRATLYRKFKTALKISPADYITNRRMSLAMKLLKNPDISVKATARSVGYGNQMYFAKVFKKSTGFTPVEYKNNQVAEIATNK